MICVNEKFLKGNGICICPVRRTVTLLARLVLRVILPNRTSSWAPLSPCFRTLGYTISRETQNLQVPYFVDKNFDKAYRGASLRDLEKTIEKDYIDYIQTSCWKEKQQSKMP